MEIIRDIEKEEELKNRKLLSEWILERQKQQDHKYWDKLHCEFLSNGEYCFSDARLIRKVFEFVKENI